jgi:PleD family two-component response regulator
LGLPLWPRSMALGLLAVLLGFALLAYVYESFALRVLLSPSRMTVSVGVSEAILEDALLSTVMARVDAALYGAKQSGRDRVELA